MGFHLGLAQDLQQAHAVDHVAALVQEIRERLRFLVACVVNGVGNVTWSWLFFRLRRPDWALWQVVPFWATRLGKTTLTARQLSPRGGSLRCELRGERVLLGASAVPILSGTVDIAVQPGASRRYQ